MIGTIFDIQSFSVHDGPGIRTTVFMKGCPLRCKWCHNPEGLFSKTQLQYFEDKCIGCKLCQPCKYNVHNFLSNMHEIKWDNCIACGDCIKACPTEALALKGFNMTSEQLLAKILKDKDFYGDSGGVTFSGGEALLQSEFVADALRLCKEKNLHTAIDTSGYVSWKQFEDTLPFCDLYLYDIKAFNRDVHKKYTGVCNDLILENLKKLDTADKDIWIRIPVINGVNNTTNEMDNISNFLLTLNNIKQVTLMPYHTLGLSKYKTLGLICEYDSKDTISNDDLLTFKKIFSKKNFKIV